MAVMSALYLVVVTVIAGFIIYKWLKHRETKGKLAWLPQVPGLPVIGNGLQFGDSSEIIPNAAKMIDNHGKVILVDVAGQLNIIITDYDFTEFLLGTQDVMDKSYDYDYLVNWLGTGLLISGGQKWKTRRRLITPAFHFSILEQFLDAFETNGKILVDKLNVHLSKDVEINKYITLYALDVICETAMGVNLEVQTDDSSKYVSCVRQVCNIAVDRVFSPWKRYNFLYQFSPDYYREKNNVEFLHSITNSIIDARRNAVKTDVSKKESAEGDDVGSKRKMAFLEILLQSTVDGEPLSREDIREEVDTFMFEGHDTTASAMTFAVYLLAQHQDIQQIAAEEQMTIFREDLSRKATYQDLQDMKYLDCVIKETLRLYPSVPFYARRAHEDISYKGNTIPKDTNLTIFTFKILRDPDNFPDPLKFDPGRFEENTLKKRPFAYVPFSAGSRNCIGQRFAMLEMKSTLSKLLRNFHIFPCPDYKMQLVLEIVLKAKHGVKIKLEKRLW